MKARRAAVLLLAGLTLACDRGLPEAEPAPVAEVMRPAVRTPGVRMTMEALHASDGTPPGWKFSTPPGDAARGRDLFEDFACHRCHAIGGEEFGDVGGPSGPGPELTGMGSHHPPGYFAEAIVHPNAVLVEGPGYLRPDGLSVMPEYPDMTLEELGDLVAYLASLTGPDAHGEGEVPPCHAAAEAKPEGESPANGHEEGHSHAAAEEAPSRDSLAWFAQAYEVEGERIDEFYGWFDREEFRRIEGLVRIETYASRSREGRHTILSMFGFRTESEVEGFLLARASIPVPGDFVRPVAESRFETPPVYRAVQMSSGD